MHTEHWYFQAWQTFPNIQLLSYHPLRFPFLCGASDQFGTAVYHHDFFLPISRNRNTHPEILSLLVWDPALYQDHPDTSLPVPDWHKDFPVLPNSCIKRMPAYHFAPPPVPVGKAQPENTGHTYGPLQPPEKTSVPPFHNFVLLPNQKHTFSQYDIADMVSPFSLRILLLQEMLPMLSHTISVPAQHPHPVPSHPQTSGQGRAWQTHSPALLPEGTSDMPFQNPVM